MTKLKIEDLKKIKETVLREKKLGAGASRAKITVHMGTCGIAAGARTIMSVLLKKVDDSAATDIIITSSGCAGLCSREPMITVEVQDMAPVKYVDLDEEKAGRIFDEHIIGGTPVEELALSVGNENAY